MKKILIVDDEQDIVESLKFVLEVSGYVCYTAFNGEDGLRLAKEIMPDLIILDVMMPKINGYKISRLLKYDNKYKDIPILMVTARSQEEDKIIGEETGADEYITKPVSMVILEAKVNALIKRYKGLLIRDGIIRVGDLKIEPARRLVTVSDKIITLAPKEYELLIYLMENKNQILTREQILNHIWGPEYDGYDRAVDTHIKKLRAALLDSSYHVVTVIKKGYMWEE